MTPYNTGKVKIGLAHTKLRQLTPLEVQWQRAILMHRIGGA